MNYIWDDEKFSSFPCKLGNLYKCLISLNFTFNLDKHNDFTLCLFRMIIRRSHGEDDHLDASESRSPCTCPRWHTWPNIYYENYYVAQPASRSDT